VKMPLKAWRRAKGISAEEMARRLKVSRATVIRWESGNSLSIKKAEDYCNLLGISLNDVEFNV